MRLYRKFLFWLTKAKLLFARIASGFIVNKKKRRKFRDQLFVKYKKQYLKQYLYAIDDKKAKPQEQQGNKVWVCWLQGEENAPKIVRICIESIKKHKPDGMEVIVLNNNNIKDYIDIPEYIYRKKEKGWITNTQFSDLLRIALLSKYGGMWIDATVLLITQMPSDILNSDFFAFHSVERGQHNNSWFLMSKPNHPLIISIKNLMFEYWKNEDKMLDYFQYHLFFDLMVESNENLRIEWEKVPLYWDHDCYKVARNFFNKYDEIKFKELTQHFMHKLTYKYDKNKNIGGTYLNKILELGKNE